MRHEEALAKRDAKREAEQQASAEQLLKDYDREWKELQLDLAAAVRRCFKDSPNTLRVLLDAQAHRDELLSASHSKDMRNMPAAIAD